MGWCSEENPPLPTNPHNKKNPSAKRNILRTTSLVKTRADFTPPPPSSQLKEGFPICPFVVIGSQDMVKCTANALNSYQWITMPNAAMPQLAKTKEMNIQTKVTFESGL